MSMISSNITTRRHTSAEAACNWKRNSNAWNAQIRYQGRSMTVPFFTGTAHADPTTWDVVYCLLSDAHYVMWGQTLEEFCSDFGYDLDDRDSREAQEATATYRQTVKQTRSLKRLLGDDFERFMAMDLDEELTAHCQ